MSSKSFDINEHKLFFRYKIEGWDQRIFNNAKWNKKGIQSLSIQESQEF